MELSLRLYRPWLIGILIGKSFRNRQYSLTAPYGRPKVGYRILLLLHTVLALVAKCWLAIHILFIADASPSNDRLHFGSEVTLPFHDILTLAFLSVDHQVKPKLRFLTEPFFPSLIDRRRRRLRK
jgi:hypothetical protein